jgi:TRAP-type C4-dicarboxylate transport system permease small subunit
VLSAESRKRWWDRAEHAMRAVETWLIVAILGGLVVFAAAQIVLRNFFSIGFAWGDGLARLAVLWLALLGALAASRDGRHITMGALVRFLPQRLQLVASVGANLVGALVSAALAWVSLAFVRDSREYGDLLLTTIPAWWLQAIMPVTFALMAYQFLAHAFKGSSGRSRAAETAP